MTRFMISVDIQAPPQRVWPTMRQDERWPEWTPSVMRLPRLNDGPFAPGNRARVRQPKLLPVVWQVTGLFAPLVARMLRDLNHRYLTLEANGLQARCES